VADHERFTLDTDIKVTFCDPQSPWQRGSNENTNGLLRQYFLKGTDLSLHSQAKLNSVARVLNERLKRVFAVDISVCPLCGGTLRVIGDVTDPQVIDTILVHLKQWVPPPDAPVTMPILPFISAQPCNRDVVVAMHPSEPKHPLFSNRLKAQGLYPKEDY
jgi:hypothetical protein